MGDDEVVFGFNSRLNIVAYNAGQAITDHHQPCIGISKRNLFVGSRLDRGFQRLQLLHLRSQLDELVAQALAAGFNPMLSWRSAASRAVR
jgi:hypothetical protein